MGVVRFAMLMRVAVNSLDAEGGAAVGRSLTALTALQSLNLYCNAACFVMLFLGRVLSMVEGVETRGVWAWCVLRC